MISAVLTSLPRYSSADGNAKLKSGLNAPTFSKVMLAEEQTYNGVNGNGSTDWKKNSSLKATFEQALDKFGCVSTGEGEGKTFEIGRGDTLKFTNGQNIQLTLAKQDGTPVR